jgi:peptidoglycan/LPS O-acetylase OafA/YrhL
MQRNLELDRLRAFAVLMTIYAHLDFLIMFQSNWFNVARKYTNGSDGVVLFFAISGYIISSILIPAFDKVTFTYTVKKVLMEFWVKRITRIMPMAILWLCLPLILSFIEKSIYLRYSIHGAIAALFNVYNIFAIFDKGKSQFGIYWSLSLEEQFYIFFPLFLIICRSWRNRFLFLIIFSVALNILPTDIRPSFRCEGIIYGVLLYLLSTKYNFTHDYAISKYNKTLICTLLLGLLLCATPLLSALKPPAWIFYPISPLISVVLVWLAIKQKDFIFPCKSLEKILDWLGTRSYGIYLIHITAFNLSYDIASKFPSHNTIVNRSLLSLVIGVSLVEVCYHYIENPIRNWGRYIAKNGRVSMRIIPVMPNLIDKL